MGTPFENLGYAYLLTRWMEQPRRSVLPASFVDYAKIHGTLVQICDSDYCAASLLGGFYEETKRSRRDFSPEELSDPAYEWAGLMMEDLFRCTGHLFSRDEIGHALSLLEAKQYINVRFVSSLDAEALDVKVNLLLICTALNTLLGNPSLPIAPTIDIYHVAPPGELSAIQGKQSHDTRKESKRVNFHLARARSLGLPATLTLWQWLRTLEHFNFKCAYCQVGAYEIFEHLTPLFHGGGTTQGNNVPACCKCNSVKRDQHPLETTGSIRESIDRVSHYLHSLDAAN